MSACTLAANQAVCLLAHTLQVSESQYKPVPQDPVQLGGSAGGDIRDLHMPAVVRDSLLGACSLLKAVCSKLLAAPTVAAGTWPAVVRDTLLATCPCTLPSVI